MSNTKANTINDDFNTQLLSDEGETEELARAEMHAELARLSAEEDEARAEVAASEFHRGWPGDGSGEDDLADYNQREADDYRDEG